MSDRISEILERNNITPAVAKDEIEEIVGDLESISDSIDHILPALDYFDVDQDDVEPGHAQLSYLVPREAVNSSLSRFRDELDVISRYVGVFSEIYVGKRPNLKLRSLSSSDFSVFIDIAPEVAARLAAAIDHLVNTYKTLVQIRQHRHQLQELNVPEASLEGLSEHANTMMKGKVKEITSSIVNDTDAKIPEGRENELEVDLRLTLNGIANRLDKGFCFEITAKPLPDDDDDENESNDDAEARDRSNELIARIKALEENTKFLKLGAPPLLQLEEKRPRKKRTKCSTGKKKKKT